jgi:tetratricopeptide (TPR) repeat protein
LKSCIALDDHTGASQACYVLGLVHMRRGSVDAMEEIARRGLDHARRSGHPREELAARWWVAWPVRAGRTPVQEAIRVCEELVPWRGTEHMGVLAELAHLRAMLGEFDEAHALIVRARQVGQERMRARRPLMFVAGSSGAVEILARDFAAAEPELRKSLAMALEMGEREEVAQFAAGLSQVLSSLGRVDEAATFASMSMENAPGESVVSQALWRTAKARVIADRRGSREAERLAREAVRLVPAELPNLQGDLLIDLAEVLRKGGNSESATQAVAEAIELFERKGNLVSAARALALMNDR